MLFLYSGYVALRHAIDDPPRADWASAVPAMVGALNVPIIYFSVRLWNTLHQGASMSLTSASTMARVMLAGMLIMTLAAWCDSIAAALAHMQAIILERERAMGWIGELAGESGSVR